MKLVLYADVLFAEHETPRDHPECPERITAVLAGLGDLEVVGTRLGAVQGDPRDVERVHDPGYVAAIEAAASKGGGALDSDTWVSPRSYEVALAASGTVVAATESVLVEGAPPAFAVVRPPGHHARPARGMGFCLFNNVAVAAAKARAVHGLERVAVLDFDVHHGNGTQEIFWNDPAVFYVSTHQYPFYPGTGSADETGEGPGLGTTLNLPLRAGTPPPAYQEAFQTGLDAIVAWKPELIVVSAGFDAYQDDPLAGMTLEAEQFRWFGQQLRAAADAVCGGRLVAALEGGYALDALGDLAAEFCRGVAGAR